MPQNLLACVPLPGSYVPLRSFPTRDRQIQLKVSDLDAPNKGCVAPGSESRTFSLTVGLNVAQTRYQASLHQSTCRINGSPAAKASALAAEIFLTVLLLALNGPLRFTSLCFNVFNSSRQCFLMLRCILVSPCCLCSTYLRATGWDESSSRGRAGDTTTLRNAKFRLASD